MSKCKYLLFGLILIPTYGQNTFKERKLELDTHMIVEQVIDNHTKDVQETIKQVETGGNYNAKGATYEIGAYQIQPATWKGMAGTLPMTPENQDKVVYKQIKEYIAKGYSLTDIALTWNQGHRGVCKSGVNKKGVAYDSCAYVAKIKRAYVQEYMGL